MKIPLRSEVKANSLFGSILSSKAVVLTPLTPRIPQKEFTPNSPQNKLYI